MDNKTKDALKQLQAEIRQLQIIVAAKHEGANGDLVPADEKMGVHRVKDAVVQYTVSYPIPGQGPDPKKMTAGVSAAQLARVTGEAAAALGSALASPMKIALLRALLDRPSESAAVLGEVTGLSTGSLYHHLRELMRSGLIHQAARNVYVLTERGTRVLLMLLALASE